MGRKDKTSGHSKTAATPTKGQPARAPPAARVPQEEDGSRQLAALAFGLLVLLASPTLTFESKETPLLMLSAIECAAAAVIQHLPPLRPITQQLMFPAVFTKRLSKVAMGCLYEKKEEMCDAWGTVVDVKSLWTEADMTPLLITLNKGVPEQNLNLLLGGALIITFGALMGMYRPVKMSIIGFFMIVYAGYFTDSISFLPSIIMETFLLGYSVFYNMFPDNRPRQPVGPPPPAARPTVKGAGTTMAAPVAAATAVASPAAKAPVSEAAHGSVSQRKNAAGSPYDI